MINQDAIKQQFGDDASLCFYQHSRQHYAIHVPLHDNRIDEIQIGVYHEGEGTSCEFKISWSPLAEDILAPQLVAFDDSWQLFGSLAPFFELLSQHAHLNTPPTKMAQELIRIGFKDLS